MSTSLFPQDQRFERKSKAVLAIRQFINPPLKKIEARQPFLKFDCINNRNKYIFNFQLISYRSKDRIQPIRHIERLQAGNPCVAKSII